MKEFTIGAKPENVDTVIDLVEEQLDECGCTIRQKALLIVAVDEIFSNIANYAYTHETGEVTIIVDISCEPRSVAITFIDSGVQYDPLAKEDPDTTLPLDQRPIGGLGIYIVKKSMDSVDYEYKDGKNILTVRKVL